MSPPASNPADFKDPRHRLGLEGEVAALDWLRENGWTLEAHRFKLGRNEIDLVVRLGAIVAFVEVKTRWGSGFGAGREAIGWRKRQALGRVAEVWCQRHGRPGDEYRFDFIEVIPQGGGRHRIVHVPDAWRLDPRVR